MLIGLEEFSVPNCNSVGCSGSLGILPDLWYVGSKDSDEYAAAPPTAQTSMCKSSGSLLS